MKKTIHLVIATALAITGLLATQGIITAPLLAASPEQSLCEGSGGTWSGTACTNGDRSVLDTIKAVNNILIFITGAIAVIMVIIGGLRYAMSNGDASATSSAKNTILYALIGIVVAFSAWAIVNFVTDQIV